MRRYLIDTKLATQGPIGAADGTCSLPAGGRAEFPKGAAQLLSCFGVAGEPFRWPFTLTRLASRSTLSRKRARGWSLGLDPRLAANHPPLLVAHRAHRQPRLAQQGKSRQLRHLLHLGEGHR